MPIDQAAIDAAPAGTTLPQLFGEVDALIAAGQLRRLSGAFARFVGTLGTLGTPSPLLALACVLLSELEGRGHSCLLLDDLARDPAMLMGWSAEQWDGLRSAVLADDAEISDLPSTPDAWRRLLAGCAQVWPVGDQDRQQPLVLDGARLYLRRYWRDETLVAAAVRARTLAGAAADGGVDAGGGADAAAAGVTRRWLDLLFDHAPRGGTDWQKVACAVALRGRLAIITGGPGTGKTYTAARLLALLFATAGARRDGLRIALAAPTGKAAARLKQSIDQALDELAGKLDGQQRSVQDGEQGGALPLRELTKRMGAARTLHSLLGARPDTRAFQYHAGNPLDVDVLIVDEASMIHLEMMASLLAALPPSATLVLLGDKDQLASVEAGAVLGDLCHDAQAGGYTASTAAYVESASGERIALQYLGGAGPIAQQTVMLRESRRFGGPIGALALAVNAGDAARAVQVLRAAEGDKVTWLDPAQPSDLLALALAGRTGAPGGYQPYLQLIRDADFSTLQGDAWPGWVLSVLRAFEGFRILCAVRDGEWGVTGLNLAIEQRLEAAGWLRRRGEWYVGRPVMVTRNDYGTGVFNGDIGLVLPDPERPGTLRVYFAEGETVRSVLATRLRHVETAFAMTVHKSQGSEFRHTVLALPRDGGGVLARELVYTGITRAREFFTLVSPGGQVLLEAIGQRTQRASGLRELLET